MKLTLEHTTDFHDDNCKVSVEIERDDLTITEIWGMLIRPGLLGMTFSDADIDSLVFNDADIEPIEYHIESVHDEHPAVIDPAFKYKTRDGREVTGLRETGSDKWALSGYVNGVRLSWTADGKWGYWDGDNDLDLIPTGEVAP